MKTPENKAIDKAKNYKKLKRNLVTYGEEDYEGLEKKQRKNKKKGKKANND